jgi:ParB-like chromosome segregation protein Spo0J
MQTQLVSISKVKPNQDNPRIIKDYKFKKLVQSIKDFPQMLELRPIVVNEDNIVLGGNMRLKACQEAGLKEVHIIQAKDLTPEQQKEFIIKDNVGFGEWDWDILANEWDNEKLNEWGLDVWVPEEEVDYSILDDDAFEADLEDMKNGVKKAIQIPFELEHYDEAFELVKFWREQGAYVGMMLIEKLKQEKNEKD